MSLADLECAVARFREKHDPSEDAGVDLEAIRAEICADVRRDLLQELQILGESSTGNTAVQTLDGGEICLPTDAAVESTCTSPRLFWTEVCIFREECKKLAAKLQGTVRFLTGGSPPRCVAYFRFIVLPA